MHADLACARALLPMGTCPALRSAADSRCLALARYSSKYPHLVSDLLGVARCDCSAQQARAGKYEQELGCHLVTENTSNATMAKEKLHRNVQRVREKAKCKQTSVQIASSVDSRHEHGYKLPFIKNFRKQQKSFMAFVALSLVHQQPPSRLCFQ